MPGERLFTTWLTSTSDGQDHAVTDEEFTEHRPEPEAVCGVVVALAPMERAPGPRCPRCVAFLRARESLRDLDDRVNPHRHRRAGWLYRLVHTTLAPAVPRPRAGARHGGPEHPAAVRPDSAAAGPEPLCAGEVALGPHEGTASAAMWWPMVAAEAHSPAGSLSGEPTGSTPVTAASGRTPSVGVVDGSTAATRRAAAPPLSPPSERRGTQLPADAACSPAAAPAGHDAPEGDAGR